MPTPPEPGQPGGRRAIEPTYVQRRRRTEALAQLLKEVREEQHGPDADENYEVIAVPATTVTVAGHDVLQGLVDRLLAVDRLAELCLGRVGGEA
ncbi:hypothetical protein ABT255_59735, partial [Streptomyces mirabilis]